MKLFQREGMGVTSLVLKEINEQPRKEEQMQGNGEAQKEK